MKRERGFNNNIDIYSHKSPEKPFDEKERLKIDIESRYDSFPEKRRIGNPDANLAKNLGSFLVDEKYITKIDTWNSWGCRYQEGVISMNEQPMPPEAAEYYIFRLGKNSVTGEYLFPKKEERADGEVKQYQLLHETGHAYQNYLKSQDPEGWFDKAISKNPEEKSSPLEKLFKFCYEQREGRVFGLSTWGNVPDYDEWAKIKAHQYLEGKDKSDKNIIEEATDFGIKCEHYIRSWEDANELVTMYLWHPEYLDTFLEYLSGNIDGYGDQDIKKDKLIKITNKDKYFLKETVQSYIKEMKENISKNRN